MSKVAVVITSISGPNAVMKAIASDSVKNNFDFLMIGDTKTPVDFKLEGCDYYSVERQLQLPYSLAKLLPTKHYSRKNLGYLIAANHDIIVETDDDNFPREEFWKPRSKKISASRIDNNGWTNVYRCFSDEEIWPRGFPLELLLPHKENTEGEISIINCPIQQGLADENPDVDAVYRMNRKLPVSFNKRSPVALGNKTWCPFNSQNTTWYKEAYPLLYLPSYCSFRMTDIWRSFIAQRIAWTCGWPILFHEATVWQERNAHNLLKDFEDEIPGYLNNAKICQLLEGLDLKNGIENISENLLRCYKLLTENNFIGKEEMPLVEAWVKDLISG
jgi:hypothetical protein